MSLTNITMEDRQFILKDIKCAGIDNYKIFVSKLYKVHYILTSVCMYTFIYTNWGKVKYFTKKDCSFSTMVPLSYANPEEEMYVKKSRPFYNLNLSTIGLIIKQKWKGPHFVACIFKVENVIPDFSLVASNVLFSLTCISIWNTPQEILDLKMYSFHF